MNVLVYSTGGRDIDPSAPVVFVRESAGSNLPFHPDGGDWVYRHTLAPGDPALTALPAAARRAIDLIGFYIEEARP